MYLTINCIFWDRGQKEMLIWSPTLTTLLAEFWFKVHHSNPATLKLFTLVPINIMFVSSWLNGIAHYPSVITAVKRICRVCECISEHTSGFNIYFHIATNTNPTTAIAFYARLRILFCIFNISKWERNTTSL